MSYRGWGEGNGIYYLMGIEFLLGIILKFWKWIVVIVV